MKEKKFVLKSSFVVGCVALVFLIVGYQCAVFVHSAAVAKIAADRDCPDTVYVAVNNGQTGPRTGVRNGEIKAAQWSPPASGMQKNSTDEGSRAQVTERRSGAHSAVGEKIRQEQPRRKVESFRFNPNTASLEELQRLGFSPKQAQAIDNYRAKGGRFVRKSDFAKSFVVSDSIYRRLEPYIDIPRLDLNLADSAAFDALPGIGGWFARLMVEHRDRLGGYSFPEQLMEIRKFDREKFDALSDLIYVSEKTAVPYPLWTLPEEKLRRHPYIGNSAHGIILFRQSRPKDKWSIEELRRERVITEESAEKLSRCIILAPE